MTVPLITLNDGHTIPQLGFGVFQVDPLQTERIVSEALAIGYRHIDTAAIYGNESGVGRAIAASGIPRDELFVTTKLWNGDQGREKPLEAVEISLQKLGLDYVDLYLIHWPTPKRYLYLDSWHALERIHASGTARSIGVSNFQPEHLDVIIAASDKVPAVNQIELHPAFSQPELRAKHAALGIHTEAWGPLGQGKYPLFDLAPIRDAATAHEVSPAQVVIRWHIQLGNILFPKSNSPQRMAENFDVFDFALTDDEMAAIDALDENKRVGGHPDEVN